jgi:6-phosphofructokinase
MPAIFLSLLKMYGKGASVLALKLQAIAHIDCTACILGHIQRGGSPVAKDRILATKLVGGCARHHSWEIKHHDCRAE